MATDALTDERILHLVDVYVGGPSPNYPLDNSDWIAFARAIEGELRAALASAPAAGPARALTYSSTQATECAGCGVRKHTPLRIDAMGGYVCLTCIDNKLGSMLGEFGHAEPEQPAPQAGAAEVGQQRCRHCIDRRDGFYGSYAPPCPTHDDDGKLRATPHPTEQPSQDAHPQAQAMAPADLSSILACEIECSVYEKHVAPVLERLGLAGVTVTLAPTCFADWLLAQPEPSAEALRQAGKWGLADAAFEAGRSAHIRGDA